MQTKQTILRWTTGLLTAGGAFFLAACYGPQRPPQGPPMSPAKRVTGTVLFEGQPVESVAVCDTKMPRECPMTDVNGRFELRYEDDGTQHEFCTKNAVAEAANQYTTECIKLQDGASEITISVQKIQP